MHIRNTSGLRRGGWVKGQSGNPGGRPKGASREMLREAVRLLLDHPALIEALALTHEAKLILKRESAKSSKRKAKTVSSL